MRALTNIAMGRAMARSTAHLPGAPPQLATAAMEY